MQKFIIVLVVLVISIFSASGCSTPPPKEKKEAPPVQSEPANPPEEVEIIDTFLLEEGAAVKNQNLDYQEPESITVLVNKQNSLPSDYVPSDLVEAQIPFSFSEKSPKRMLRAEAAAALEELFAAAKEEGHILYGVSGYRSYDTQRIIFTYNINRFGSEKEANKISARPGESEHQSGLAMDISCQRVLFNLSKTFGETPEFSWAKENAHRFGFIIRYPKGKEYMTDYIYEPWHLRYVGTEVAREVYNNNITYEEYLFFE